LSDRAQRGIGHFAGGAVALGCCDGVAVAALRRAAGRRLAKQLAALQQDRDWVALEGASLKACALCPNTCRLRRRQQPVPT
jgi:hypothetical protein